ncbi:hypothetical protein SELMODRAFT_421235 [Selaginella moellendorffii]|uniref:Uncharacterized protein n=1 Tax=Selaginella moellendorffii TaxID=88036 RepID=D8SEF5_SELML|nr:hypothetical protein SELMODRAFT_421235 [Selaginella moellendorffii]
MLWSVAGYFMQTEHIIVSDFKMRAFTDQVCKLLADLIHNSSLVLAEGCRTRKILTERMLTAEYGFTASMFTKISELLLVPEMSESCRSSHSESMCSSRQAASRQTKRFKHLRYFVDIENASKKHRKTHNLVQQGPKDGRWDLDDIKLGHITLIVLSRCLREPESRSYTGRSLDWSNGEQSAKSGYGPSPQRTE